MKAVLAEEATDGTTGSSGGATTEPNALELGAAARAQGEEKLVDVEKHVDTAPDVADTSGDTAGQPAGAHLDVAAEAEASVAAAPAAVEETGDEYADACKAGTPRIALVGKYSDRVPVQLKSKAHLAELEAVHPGSVEVQS